MTGPSHDLAGGLGRRRGRRLALIFGGVVALGIGLVLALSLGSRLVTPGGALLAIVVPALPTGWLPNIDPMNVTVLYQLRLPRAVMAMVTGAGLAMAGVAMQGVTRNPLVSPYTLGISPAAAFGASVSILLGLGPGWMVAGAFASALLCAAIVLMLAMLRGVSAIVLILGGVGLTYLFTALTATIQFVATEQQLAAIVQWTFGSLNGIGWHQTGVAGGILLIATPFLLAEARALDAFAAGGEEMAVALGFHVMRTRMVVTVASVLITAGIVSFVGVIGFVGLVAPHIARMVIGGAHRWLLPFAALVGALLVLLSDLIGRLVFEPVIIPVGIVVAYVGVPVFLHLLLSRRHEFAA